MDEQKQKKQTHSRVKKSSNTIKYFAIAALGLLFIGAYLYMQQELSTPDAHQAGNTSTVKQNNLPSLDHSMPSTNGFNEILHPMDGNTSYNQQSSTGTDSLLQDDGPTIDTLASPGAGDPSSHSQQSVSPDSPPQYLVDEINLFYTHLDKQPYMQSFGLKDSSKIHFSKLFQKLLDNPPVVIRETEDLFTLLQNTAHFFRIIGKENINILKGILSNEQNSFEKVLEIFYALTYHPEYLKKEYSLSIPPDALTDYAAFFLNTMGGRLYLFRRDSTSRLVVSYYAIITIDRANIEGAGGHGIDIRPAISSLIEEIENGGRQLQLRDKYLDTLYDLQEKYTFYH